MFYTTVEFADMQQKTVVWKEDADCTVKALAIALGIPYAKAWYACRKFGRPYQEGMDWDEFMKTFEYLGYRTQKIFYTGHWHEFIRNHREGTYLIDTRECQAPGTPYHMNGHVHVYKDGIMHDAPANWTGYAKDCYKVVHKDDYVSPLAIWDTSTSGTVTNGVDPGVTLYHGPRSE